MYGRFTARTAIIAAGLAALAGAPAAAASPPENDNYLAATQLNSPGSQMPRDSVSSPVTDTSDATVQADLLSPPSVGGPPEPTACGNSPLGKTVWYRFFPDVPGRMKLEAVGFDTTLALVQFSSVQSPLPQDYTCSNRRDDTIERLEAPVEAGTGYAVQIGGAGSASGSLQVNFTFLPDRDRDGVTDDADRCPRRPGTANGCPPKIVAGIPYHYDSTPTGGARFSYLDVRGAPRGARIDVRCSRGCRHLRLRVRSAVTHVKAFSGRVIPTGARIEVRVTKSGYIGAYRAFTVVAGNVSSTDRCLPPGSTRPRRSC